MNELLESTKEIAWEACDVILEVYQSPIEVTDKKDSSPLTQADLSAHQLITRRLSVLRPAWPMLSEESAAAEIKDRLSWTTFWLIDPLDGTKEFINRNGEFTVNIALVHEGSPILGVIAAPVLNTMWYAVKTREHGVKFRVSQQGVSLRLRGIPISPSGLQEVVLMAAMIWSVF